MSQDNPTVEGRPRVPHRLAPLFDFSSIAVVGASDNAAGGPRGLQPLEALGFQGRYYPVNARAETVHGMKAYPNVSSLPEVPDMAMIAIPRRAIPDVVEECADCGVKAAVLVAAGFVEFDAEGAELQERITRTARSRGPLLVGPNCLGLVSIVNRCAAFGRLPVTATHPGNVAVISHSGGLMNEVLSAGVPRGIGFSHLVSVGNEAGVTSADLLDYFVADPSTDVVLAILEMARDPELFVAACERARAARKPIVILKMGRSEKGAYSAFTHTGALAGNDAIYSAFFRQQGITQVNDLDELIDMGVLFSAARGILQEHRLERTGVIEISGGGKELTCDTAAAAGVLLPTLSEDGESTLRTAMHDEYPATNPLDSGGGWADADKAEVYPAALEVFATEPDIDVVISRYTIPQSGELGALTQRIAEMEAARAAHPERLFVVLSRTTDRWAPSWEDAVRSHRIPFLQGYGRGPRALAHLAAYSRFLHGPDAREAPQRVERPSGFAAPFRTLDGSAARDVLAAAGIPLVATAPAGVEIVLGAQRDPKLGPAVTCGSGPVYADLFGDLVMRMAPVDTNEATAMLDELRGRRLLDGVDLSIIAKALCGLSDLMLSRPDIVDIEIKPAVVHAGGLVGVIAHVQVLDSSG